MKEFSFLQGQDHILNKTEAFPNIAENHNYCTRVGTGNQYSKVSQARGVSDTSQMTEMEKQIANLKAELEKLKKNKTADTQNNKSKGQTKASNHNQTNVTCWNCGEKGHYKYKCTKEPTSDQKTGQVASGNN